MKNKTSEYEKAEKEKKKQSKLKKEAQADNERALRLYEMSRF